MSISPLATRTVTTPARVRAVSPSPVRPVQAAPAKQVAAPTQSRLGRALEAWGWVGKALWTGREALLGGKTEPYPQLAPAQRNAAIARGEGRTIDQNFVSLDAAGTIPHELFTVVVEGTREQVAQALTSQGWVKANDRSVWSFLKVGVSVLTHLWNEAAAPVTQLFLNGRGEEMAFNKNSDFTRTRDHLRVFQVGPNKWAIAASRDMALSLTVHHPEFVGPLPWSWQFKAPNFGHQIDHDLDRERDLVLTDMLASGLVTSWSAVTGKRPAGTIQRPRPDGRFDVEGFGDKGLVTDGFVYEVKLG